MKKQQVLLLQDVESLGRKGEMVFVKAGYARNFLFPKKCAQIATAHTLRIQKKLQEERAKQAEADRKEALLLAEKLEEKAFTIEVKVDPEGHLYGSVTSTDIAQVLQKEGYNIAKKHVPLSKAMKALGTFPLTLQLNEGVTVRILFSVYPEGGKEAFEKLQEKKKTRQQKSQEEQKIASQEEESTQTDHQE